MADKKISALPAASTPLAGTEVLPIVQGGITEQVSVANLTAGRAVNALSATTTAGLRNTSAGSDIASTTDGVFLTDAANKNVIVQLGASGGLSTFIFEAGGAGWRRVSGLLTNGNSVVDVGNLVIGTAAKGIDFSANANAPGMTSELLNWYEEGVFTPNQGGGLVVVGAFSSSGRYVRYGNMITVQVFLQGATSIAWASGAAVLFTNLPFTAKTGFECTGVGHSSNYTTGFSVLTAGTNTVFSVEAQGAVANVSITLTYFV